MASYPGNRVRRYNEQGMYIRCREVFDLTTESEPISQGLAERSAPDDKTLLCLHGLGESGLCFEHLLEFHALGEWRMLVPDLPGYGRSTWPTRPLTLASQADHLASWLRATGEGPLAVLGHSLGGVLGLIFCENHPNLVSHFVNVDGNLSEPDCVFSGQAANQDLTEFLAAGFAELCAGVYEKGKKDPAHRDYYVSLRLCNPQAFHLNSQELVQMSRQGNLAQRLAALPLPTHYIAGVPDGVSKESQDLLDKSGVTWSSVKPAGHWPFIDRPDVFVERLQEALS